MASMDGLNDLTLSNIFDMLPIQFQMLCKCVNVRMRDLVDENPSFRNCPKIRKSLIFEMERLWAISCRQYAFPVFPLHTTGVAPQPHSNTNKLTAANIGSMLLTDEVMSSSPNSLLSLDSTGTEIYNPPTENDFDAFVYQTPVGPNGTSSSDSSMASSSSSLLSETRSFQSFGQIVQNSSRISNPDDFMKVRTSVIIWVRFVCKEMNLFSETLLVTIDIFDRFVSLAHANTWHNLLTHRRIFDVASACLAIAGKYIDNNTVSLPRIRRYHSIDPKTLVDFERMILTNLDWNVPWFHIREAIASAARIFVALIPTPEGQQYLSDNDVTWNTLIPACVPEESNRERMHDTFQCVFLVSGLHEFMGYDLEITMYEAMFNDCVDFWVLTAMWAHTERPCMLQRGMLTVGCAILLATIRLLQQDFMDQADADHGEHLATFTQIEQVFLTYNSRDGDVEFLRDVFVNQFRTWETEKHMRIPGKVWPYCRHSLGRF